MGNESAESLVCFVAAKKIICVNFFNSFAKKEQRVTTSDKVLIPSEKGVDGAIVRCVVYSRSEKNLKFSQLKSKLSELNI